MTLQQRQACAYVRALLYTVASLDDPRLVRHQLDEGVGIFGFTRSAPRSYVCVIVTRPRCLRPGMPWSVRTNSYRGN